MIKVIVEQGQNQAIFNWNDDCTECDYTAIGFEESEIDAIIESKAHMGKKVEGYEVQFDA